MVLNEVGHNGAASWEMSAELVRKLENGAELSSEERAELVPSLQRVVEVYLETGRSANAWDALVRGESSGSAPSTTGDRPLSGATDLIFYPYETRDHVMSCLYQLCLRALDDGDMAVVPWILQMTKLAFPAERRAAYGTLSQLSVDEQTISSWSDDFARSLTAQNGRPFEMAMAMQDALMAFADPRWSTALARTLSRADAARAAKLDQAKLWCLGGARPTRQAGRSPIAAGLFEMREGRGGSAQIVAALRAAWLLGEEASHWSDAALAATERFPRPAAVESLARVLNGAKAFIDDACRDRLEALVVACAEGARPGDRDGASAQVSALLANAAPVAKSGVWTSKPHGLGEELWAPGVRILRRSAVTDWRTNEDEFGLVRATASKHRWVRLPIRFPVRNTGAAGQGRRIDGVAILPGGELLLTIQSPFARGNRWGTENYLVSYSADRDVWRVWQPRGSDPFVAAPVDPAADIEEGVLAAVCEGELNVNVRGKALLLTEDLTPYHLDSYEGPKILRQLPGLAGDLAVQAWGTGVEASAETWSWRGIEIPI